MVRLFRWILIASLLLIMLLVTALALPFLVDFSHLKTPIRAEVTRLLNANIEFDSARLTLFPHPGIRLHNVTLTNTKAPFDGTKFLSVEKVTFNVNLGELKNGRLAGDLEIVKPRLEFVIREATNNLETLMATQPPLPQKTAETGGGEGTTMPFRSPLALHKVRLHDASLLIENGDASTKTEVSNLDILLVTPTPNADIPISVSNRIAYAGGRFAANGKLATNGFVRIEESAGRLSKIVIRGETEASEMSFVAFDMIEKSNGVPCSISFDIELPVAELSQPLWWSKSHLTAKLRTGELHSANSESPDLKATELNAQFNMTDGKLAVKETSVHFFDGKTILDVESDLLQKPQRYSFRLSSEKMRVEKILAALIPKHQPVINGELKLSLNGTAHGDSDNTLVESAKAKGQFLLANGSIQRENISALLEREMNRALNQIPFTKKPSLFEESELSDANLNPAAGTIDFSQKKIRILGSHSDKHDNKFLFDITADTDEKLAGKAQYTLSETTKNRLLSKSKYFALLLNPKGEAHFAINLGGTVSEPQALVDFAEVRSNLKKNSNKLLEQKLKRLLGK